MKKLLIKLKLSGKILRYSFRVAPLETILLFIIYTISAADGLITGYFTKIMLDHISANDLVDKHLILVLAPLIFLIGYKMLEKLLHLIQWAVIESIFRWKLQDNLWLDFHSKLSSLDIPHFEDSETFNKMLQARSNLDWRPYQTIKYIFSSSGSFLSLILGVGLAVSFGWYIPLIIFLAIIPRTLLGMFYEEAQWSVFDEGAESNKQIRYLSHILTDVENIKEIKVFRAQNKIMDMTRNIQTWFFKRNRKEAIKYGLSNFVSTAIEMIAFIWILGSQYMDAIKGVISIGDFVFFQGIVFSIFYIASDIIIDIANFLGNSLYVQYFFDVISLKDCIKKPANPILPKFETKTPSIEFKNVSFRYKKEQPLVLNNISFVLNPGENIALVGENGAGKSTLIKLLLRFYDVTSGEILIGGVNIKEIDLNWWYDQLGTLFQHFIKYNFSVKESITLTEKAVDMLLLRKAAELSGASEFIESFPQKYDQMLGVSYKDGKELSGGQWQKIALARAFYRMPNFLILDEPTSAIDAQAEYEIFKNINDIYEDEKSLLIVSHRFSTVRNADRILVIDQGKIVESGSHSQLMESGGLYSKMFSTQAEGYK